MKVFEALGQVKDGKIAEYQFGICYNVEEILRNCGDRIAWAENQDECFEAWPEHSGDSDYPVPSCSELHPRSIYIRCDGDDFWNPEHPYGAARLRLLDHCIEWFKSRDL